MPGHKTRIEMKNSLYFLPPSYCLPVLPRTSKHSGKLHTSIVKLEYIIFLCKDNMAVQDISAIYQ